MPPSKTEKHKRGIILKGKFHACTPTRSRCYGANLEGECLCPAFTAREIAYATFHRMTVETPEDHALIPEGDSVPSAPPPPSPILQVKVGSVWKLATAIPRASKLPLPPSFRTERIDAGYRHGTVVVVVQELCAMGCHATVKTPLDDLATVEIANLLPV